MKLHILSDLHRDGDSSFEINQTDADVIILAGDIDKGKAGLLWADQSSHDLNKPIIYVPGNHEYYGYDYAELNTILKEDIDNDVHVLDNKTFTYKDVRFLGTTLWSNFRALGDNKYKQAKEDSARWISDYHKIKYHGVYLTPNDTEIFYERAVNWLYSELAKPFSGKTVLVVHHGPSPSCHNPVRHGLPEPVSAYFWSDLEDLIQPGIIDLVIYGHTHSNLRFKVNDVPVVCNQKGYKRENIFGHGPEDFDPNYIMEI